MQGDLRSGAALREQGGRASSRARFRQVIGDRELIVPRDPAARYRSAGRTCAQADTGLHILPRHTTGRHGLGTCILGSPGAPLSSYTCSDLLPPALPALHLLFRTEQLGSRRREAPLLSTLRLAGPRDVELTRQRNAASTYNLLTEEGRTIGAALCPLKPVNPRTGAPR